MDNDHEGVSRRGLITSALPLALGTAAVGGYLASSRGAMAQEAASQSGKLSEVLRRGHLIAGVTLTIPPFGYRNESGEIAGFDVDICRILANGLFGDPSKVEFYEQEMDARLPNLASGKTDIAVQLITVTASRAQTVEFTVPYFREGITTLHLADSAYSGAAAMSGRGARVSILQNTFAEDLVKMAIPDANVEQFDSVSSSLLALDGGRVDAYVGGRGEIDYFNAQRPGKYKVGDTGWLPQTYAAAVRPGDQQWLNYVNTTLHEAMTGVAFNEYADSFKAHFGIDVPQPLAGYPREFFSS